MDDLEPIAGYANKRTMLEELYTHEGLAIREIAERLGVGTATVERWMVGLDIPKRGRGGDNMPAKLGWKIHRLDPRDITHMTVRDLARLVQASESYVWKFRRGMEA